MQPSFRKTLLAAPLLLALLGVAAAQEVPATAGLAAAAGGIVHLAQAARPLERGEASYYGPGLHGRRTASGERFDRGALTAAHRSLPFGTLVRVHNLLTGRSVDVRINDRGPFARHRIIDLSEAAARRIGLHRKGPGTAPVRVTVL